jgi:hypothetical protein
MMSEAFLYRLALGDAWSKEVKSTLECDKDLIVVPMGAENVVPQIQNIISSMKHPDETIKFIRFFPDGYVINPDEESAFFYDAKYGTTIEKDAYKTYLAFSSFNRRLLIFIKNISRVYCVPLNKMIFQDSEEYVSHFPKEKQLPIDKEGWIAPRKLPQEKYDEWKWRNINASGTPFKYFDFSAMLDFEIQGAINNEALNRLFSDVEYFGQQKLGVS